MTLKPESSISGQFDDSTVLDGIVTWMTDERGAFTFINRQWFDWTGTPPQQDLDNGWISSIIEEDRVRVLRKFRGALQNRSNYTDYFKITGVAGTMHKCKITGDPYYNNTGAFAGYVGACILVDKNLETKSTSFDDEMRLRLALQSGRFGIWDVDVIYRTITWDEYCKTVFGETKKNVVSYNDFLKYIAEHDRVRVHEGIQSALNAQFPGHFDMQFRTVQKAGQKMRWVHIRGKVYFENNVPYKFSGTLVDITEEKRKDAALHNIERRFQIAFDNASLGIVISDAGGRFVMINKAFEEMVGYSQQELYSESYVTLTHPEDLARNKDLVDQVLRKEISSFEIEKRYLRKDGSIVWVVLHTTMIRDEKDNDDIFFSIIQDITTTIRAREDQQKLFTLVENSVDLMSILEVDGTNSYINKAGRDLLGFTSEQQVFTTPIEKLHAPEHFEYVYTHVIPSIMNDGKWSGEVLVRHLTTGETIPVFNNSLRIDDPTTGIPIAVGAVMRDLRPEIAAKQALIESERRFRHMIEQAPVAIGLLKGREMVIESANDLMLEIWGKSSDVTGMPLMEALPELKGQKFMDLLTKVLDTGEAYYGYGTLAKMHRKNGMEDGYFNFVYAPVREQPGMVSGVLVVATEVTGQVKAKKELVESEKRFRSLIAEAPMATAVYTGEEMIIQLANEAMLNLWGKDSSVIGKRLRDAVPELEGQPFHDLLNKVFVTGIPYHSAESPADLMVGGRLKTFYFNFNYKPLKNGEGKVYAILNMAVDVTDQKMMAEKLEQRVEERTVKLMEANADLERVNTNLEQFAYVTSHDLQEPLRKIRMFSDVLQTRHNAEMPLVVQEYLNKISKAAGRMSNLIRDLLEFSRLEGKENEFAETDLNIIIEDLKEDFELLAKEKDAEFVVGQLPVIEAIPLQINQLFYNLIGNALKFTKTGIPPVIEISSHRKTSDEMKLYPRLNQGLEYTEIIVRDNGIGFDQHFGEVIFVIFQRLHPKDKFEGTGIGLALCKKIVSNHHGEISAFGEKNVGASFHILLPLKQTGEK